MTFTLKSQALVLQGMRWSESSKIVHLFTARKGYLKVIPRGVLRPRSPLRGVLENLNHIEVVVSVKESRGLQIISQAVLINPFSDIRENLEHTAVAFSVLELLRSLIHGNEPVQPLFNHTIKTLQGLNRKNVSHPLLILMNFIIFFSEYLGFGWNFSECRLCKKTAGSFSPLLDPVNGAVVCPTCARQGGGKTIN